VRKASAVLRTRVAQRGSLVAVQLPCLRPRWLPTPWRPPGRRWSGARAASSQLPVLRERWDTALPAAHARCACGREQRGAGPARPPSAGLYASARCAAGRRLGKLRRTVAQTACATGSRQRSRRLGARRRAWALGRCRSWQRLLMEADLPPPSCWAAWLSPPPAATRSNSAVAARSRRRPEAQPSPDGPGCCAEQEGCGSGGPGIRSAAPTHYKAAKFCIDVCQ